MKLRNSRSRLTVFGTLLIAAFLLGYFAPEKSKSTTSSPFDSPLTLQADGGAPPPPPPLPLKPSQNVVALS